MKQYIALLKTTPTFKYLSIIQLISYFGAWFSNIAIYTLLLDLNVSKEVIAFTAMVHFLAGVVQAPFSGAIIDSVKPKVIMLTLLAIEIFATLFLLFVTDIESLWLLYTLIFIKMAAASFYFTTEMSLLPKILERDKLLKANELHSIIWSLSYTLGMAIGGFMVYSFGIEMAFILDASMFVVGFILLYNLELEVEISQVKENLLEMMQNSFRYLKEKPETIHIMMIHAFVGLTAFDALVVLMVDQYYSAIIATSLALGLLHSFRAIGLIVGPMIIGDWIDNKHLTYIFIGQAVSLWLWASWMDNFYLSLLASIVVGLFTTTLWSYTYTLLQHNIDEKYYGRIIAYNDMLFLSSAALTSFMIGFLASNGFSLESVTTILGFGFIVGGVYYRWVLKTQNVK